MGALAEPAATPITAASANTRPLTICAIGYATSTHVAARVRCFVERGHKVFLITESPSPNGIPGVVELVPGYDPQLGVCRWFRLLSWGCRKLFRVDPDHAWRVVALIRFLRYCKPDIVHVHFAYSYYGWLAAVLGCRPLVVTVMGGDVLFDEQGAPTACGKWLTLKLLESADYITSKSNYLIEVLDRLGAFGGKAERIVWGIPIGRFRRRDATALRDRLGLSPERRVVLSPKILQPLYRVDLVVEAMAEVVRQCPDAVLLITEYSPDPDYRAAIVQRIAALDLADHVKFVGRIEHDNMPAYYSLAEMTVAVPSSDGLPQTLLEGMACEVPSILSRLPRYEEIVQHRQSAYFVDAVPKSIAEGILLLLADGELRETIARNAMDIVGREGNLTEQAQRVENRYHQLAATVRPRVFSLLHLVSVARAFRGWRVAQRAGESAP
jgi:glycosyltransferase involved in cell wall biosynthesis